MNLLSYAALIGGAVGLAALPTYTFTLPKPQRAAWTQVDTTQRPEENRFTKTLLSNDLNEPMELAVAPDGRVFFCERGGKFYMYDPVQKKTRLLHDFPVKAVEKYLNGLLGMTIDPNFSQNHFLYFFYTIQDGEQTKQRIARFRINDDSTLDLASEKAIIEFPIDLEVSAHTGGSMAWDKHGNLFISTGDNTVPFESQGYAPIDQREGRLTFDAERSSGNPNDLRGKILRITVHPDGTYSIPDGNLFAKGTPGTRPEIYVMGCRNPYRISVDTATSIVYWGEIGPDAGKDAPQGPRGYDEFNQAKKAGNYGWPYFVGNTKPYHQYDFATKAIGPLFDPAAPVNNSPNNTGAKILPPAQSAMVWYPYDRSDEFPQLGVGGRCAMGGPVYHYSAALKSQTKLPAYYDKAVFYYDWMRNWVFAVRLDEQQNYQFMERFMPQTGDFRRPVDMEIGPEGSIYMLEYGSVYGIDNVDARLVRIDFNPGNRTPVATVSVQDTIGLAPFAVAFTNKSYDYDKDALTYRWQFGDGSAASSEASPTHTYRQNGIYRPILTVTDPSGRTSRDTLTIRVGNTRPEVAITAAGNQTFFFPGQTSLPYTVTVTDKQDKTIDPKRLNVTLNYIPKVADKGPQMGHQQLSPTFNLGKNLIASSDCKACHQLNDKSVGPSFTEVAKRYAGDKNAPPKLANKIITGGGGVWGEHSMSAHPQLSREEATEMAKYILSVGSQASIVRLPAKGTLTLKDHQPTDTQGRYLLSATYTDNGAATNPKPGLALSETHALVLRPNTILATEADSIHHINKQGKRLGGIRDGSFFVLNNIDLTDIAQVTYRFGYVSKGKDDKVEIRIGSAEGPIISTATVTAAEDTKTPIEIKAPVTPTAGRKNLYVVFRKPENPNGVSGLDNLTFDRK